jgi:hypothetical protein
VGAELLLAPGYAAAASAMVGTITLLSLFEVVHPPSVSTALGFSFAGREEPPVGLCLVVLVCMQRTAV